VRLRWRVARTRSTRTRCAPRCASAACRGRRTRSSRRSSPATPRQAALLKLPLLEQKSFPYCCLGLTCFTTAAAWRRSWTPSRRCCLLRVGWLRWLRIRAIRAGPLMLIRQVSAWASRHAAWPWRRCCHRRIWLPAGSRTRGWCVLHRMLRFASRSRHPLTAARAAQLLLWRAGDAAPSLAPGDAEALQPLAQAEGLEGGGDADAGMTGWLAGASADCCSD